MSLYTIVCVRQKQEREMERINDDKYTRLVSVLFYLLYQLLFKNQKINNL